MERWFNDRWILDASWNINGITTKELAKRNSISLYYQVSSIDAYTFYVHKGDRNGEVNLNMKTCYVICLTWTCGYTLVAVRVRGIDHRQFCDWKYSYTFMVTTYT